MRYHRAAEFTLAKDYDAMPLLNDARGPPALTSSGHAIEQHSPRVGSIAIAA